MQKWKIIETTGYIEFKTIMCDDMVCSLLSMQLVCGWEMIWFDLIFAVSKVYIILSSFFSSFFFIPLLHLLILNRSEGRSLKSIWHVLLLWYGACYSICILCVGYTFELKWEEAAEGGGNKKKHNKMKETKRSNDGFVNAESGKGGRLLLSVVGCLANFVIDLEFVYSPLNMLFEKWIHSDRHTRTHKILILVYIW